MEAFQSSGVPAFRYKSSHPQAERNAAVGFPLQSWLLSNGSISITQKRYIEISVF